ncbi:MAG: hypothetical protein U5L04_01665 [Trueperaceae bacterium]|nr:hypothetical protein [Trueperaceae bacterium]
MAFGPDKTANRVADRIEEELGTQPEDTRQTLVERLTWIYDELFAAAYYEFVGTLTLTGLWQKLELGPAGVVDDGFALENSDTDVVVPSTGVYRLDAHLSLSQGSGDATVEFGLSKNAFDIIEGARVRFSMSANTSSAAALSAIVEMTDGDVVSAAVREISSTGTTDVEFKQAGFTVQRVR